MKNVVRVSAVAAAVACCSFGLAGGHAGHHKAGFGFGIENFPHGVTVGTAPFLGKKSSYTGSDLFNEFPSINDDLSLLKDHKKLEKALKARGVRYGDRAYLQFGGEVEAKTTFTRTYANKNTSDIDITDAELDISAIISKWASAYMSFDYDNAAPSSGKRTSGSNLYLDQGFLTIGNLNNSPIYFTVGQNNLPFGAYTTSMVSTPLTDSLGRTTARYVQLGYSVANYDVKAYAFRSDTKTSDNSKINAFGGEFRMNHGAFKGAVGYISDIADSNGIQNNGVSTASTFQGFAKTTRSNSNAGNLLSKHVPGADVWVSWAHGPFGVYAEYVGATEKFNSADMKFDGKGAKPRAAQFELSYATKMVGKPLNVAGFYGKTWESVALNLPRESYGVAASTNLWKDTSLSVEYRHDKNYSSNDYLQNNSTGAGVALASYAGSTRNIVTFGLAVDF